MEEGFREEGLAESHPLNAFERWLGRVVMMWYRCSVDMSVYYWFFKRIGVFCPVYTARYRVEASGLELRLVTLQRGLACLHIDRGRSETDHEPSTTHKNFSLPPLSSPPSLLRIRHPSIQASCSLRRRQNIHMRLFLSFLTTDTADFSLVAFTAWWFLQPSYRDAYLHVQRPS